MSRARWRAVDFGTVSIESTDCDRTPRASVSSLRFGHVRLALSSVFDGISAGTANDHRARRLCESKRRKELASHAIFTN